MMESADHGDLNDLPMIGRLHRSRFRGVLVQRQVCPATVIIRKNISKETAQVLLVEDDHLAVWEISMPILSNSPCTLGAPRRDLACDILRSTQKTRSLFFRRGRLTERWRTRHSYPASCESRRNASHGQAPISWLMHAPALGGRSFPSLSIPYEPSRSGLCGTIR